MTGDDKNTSQTQCELCLAGNHEWEDCPMLSGAPAPAPSRNTSTATEKRRRQRMNQRARKRAAESGGAPTTKKARTDIGAYDNFQLAAATTVPASVLGPNPFAAPIHQGPAFNAPIMAAQQVPAANNDGLQGIWDLLVKQEEQISGLRGRQDALERMLTSLLSMQSLTRRHDSDDHVSEKQQKCEGTK